MIGRAVFTALVACVAVLPASPEAAADDSAAKDAGASDGALVTEVGMMVDELADGKDWAPGGHEVHLSPPKCPYKVQFKGQVTVDKPTKVTYRWEWSDGTMMPKRTFDVKTAGTMVDLTPFDVWNVGRPGHGFHSVEILHIMAPNEMSVATPVTVDCGG
jgi:hypothetical protein